MIQEDNNDPNKKSPWFRKLDILPGKLEASLRAENPACRPFKMYRYFYVAICEKKVFCKLKIFHFGARHREKGGTFPECQIKKDI